MFEHTVILFPNYFEGMLLNKLFLLPTFVIAIRNFFKIALIMKNSSFLLILSFAVCLFSCTKEVQEENNYCVNDNSLLLSTKLLTDKDLLAINNLFIANKITTYSNYQFISYEIDINGNKHVEAYPFVNGLKVLNGATKFLFDKNDKLTFSSAKNYSNTAKLSTRKNSTTNKV